MSYSHVEVELTEPLPELTAGGHDEGVGLISSRHRRVVGLALDRLAPGTHLGPSAVEALLHLHAVVPDGTSGVNGGPGPTITVAVCTRDRVDRTVPLEVTAAAGVLGRRVHAFGVDETGQPLRMERHRRMLWAWRSRRRPVIVLHSDG